MSILIAVGCSVTHGADTYNSFMHPENIKYSFPTHIANKLGVELKNIALSGASNDYIFHTAIDAINQHTDIHSIIVAWTSSSRISWISRDRHWFFNPGWASSVIDPVNFEMHSRRVGQVWLTGDNDQVLNELEQGHKFLVNNYLYDSAMLLKKLKNYSSAINAICKERSIKLVELSAFGSFNKDLNKIEYTGYHFDPNGHWRSSGNSHPSILEHKLIAQEILSKFY